MGFPLRLSNPKLTLVTGKFCLPAPITFTGTFSTAPVTIAVTSITRSGSVATVTTTTAHGLRTGEIITISGAAQYQYNGLKKIVVTTTTAFTFYVDSAATTPATGTILVTPEKGCVATGTATLAGTEFFEGDWLYVATVDAVRQVSQILSATRWFFNDNFPSNVSSQPVMRPPTAVYKGVGVTNTGAGAGVYLETAIAVDSPTINCWDETGLAPVCGDATGTTFEILTQ